VEVECDTIEQVAEALEARADLILLDNMSPEQVGEAQQIVDGAVPLEVSGRISLETVGAYAQTGIDYIAVGAITHSAPALDIALDLG
jgi:nicotinate-nucleotide pyrophosphorylase (carboxylating)